MASITAENIWTDLQTIREKSPVIHNITNYVAMNNTANALLAIGASPVMAHAQEEVEEMVSLASAVVLNIGTLSNQWVNAMFKAAGTASEKGIPVVLDPVGAGATSYRTQTARELIKAFPPAIIRGNASEVMALLDTVAKTKGVDSLASSEEAIAMGGKLHAQCGAVVCISGVTDYIIGNAGIVLTRNGCPMMARVTGLGCTASALCGALTAVNSDLQTAAAEAMAVMGIAGEIAFSQSRGPGSLQVNFLDTLYRLSAEDIARFLKIEAGK